MRVITGFAKGRKLKEPKNMDIRPTSDMVKEAVFSIIQFDIEGRTVLDLFAGTGQLGIEALSRGAKSCVFVDENREAIAITRENIAHCKLENASVIQTESLGYLERAGKFDLIFIDPPYDSGLCDKALHKIFKFDILTDGGIILCESRQDKPVNDAKAPYFFRREYTYGKTKLTVYCRQEGIVG